MIFWVKIDLTVPLLYFTAICMEPLEHITGPAVHRAQCSGQSHSLVTSPTRSARVRRGNRWPLHQVLEHTDQPTAQLCGHGVASLQSGVVKTRQWIGESYTPRFPCLICGSCLGAKILSSSIPFPLQFCISDIVSGATKLLYPTRRYAYYV